MSSGGLYLTPAEVEDLRELVGAVALNYCDECDGDHPDCPLATWIEKLGSKEYFRQEYQLPCLMT